MSTSFLGSPDNKVGFNCVENCLDFPEIRFVTCLRYKWPNKNFQKVSSVYSTRSSGEYREPFYDVFGMKAPRVRKQKYCKQNMTSQK
jgi:hypothetical protein